MLRAVAIVAILASVAFLAGVPRIASAGTLPDITGTWYAQGDHSKPCLIHQSGDSVTFTNEIDQHANGTFVDPSTLSASWPSPAQAGSRVRIVGHIANNLQLIYWDNGTYWTR